MYVCVHVCTVSCMCVGMYVQCHVCVYVCTISCMCVHNYVLCRVCVYICSMMCMCVHMYNVVYVCTQILCTMLCVYIQCNAYNNVHNHLYIIYDATDNKCIDGIKIQFKFN